MKKINLMHLTFSLDIGGLENVVLTLSKKIDLNRYHVQVCSMTKQTALSKEFEQYGIPVHRLSKRNGFDLGLPIRLAHLLNTHQVDILHTHNPGPFFYGFLAGKIARVGHLVHTEHSRIGRNHRLLGQTLSLFSRGFSKIISDSNAVTDHLICVQGIAPAKIATIYNGIDTDLYAKAVADQTLFDTLGIKKGARIIGTVGRLESDKNHATLLLAFQKACRMIPNLCLVIIGDGSLRATLMEQAKSLHIDHAVFFLGSRRDVHQILPLFDLFVFSSRSEGLPLAILEAMAAKIPIVSTRVGGIPEIIRDQESGWLVPSEDFAAIAEGITALLSDRKRADSFSAAAFKIVSSQFSIGAMTHQYEAIYSGLMKER
ncbi:MAG: glycosyltransferase [Nitrospirota bacterium]